MNKLVNYSIINLCRRTILHRNVYKCLHHPLLPIEQKHNLIKISSNSFSTCKNLSNGASIPLNKLDTKKLLSFICKKCGHRNTNFISKQAYDKGVVIVRCDGCQNNHLIADNLNWFQLGEIKNIEDILAEKGETVMKELQSDGSLEIVTSTKKD